MEGKLVALVAESVFFYYTTEPSVELGFGCFAQAFLMLDALPDGCLA